MKQFLTKLRNFLQFEMTSTNKFSRQTLDLHKTLEAHQHSGAGWNSLWANGATPWNLGKPAPPFCELFDNKTITKLGLPANCRALVPGCGEGYDVMYLASRPEISSVTALEISDIAISKIKAAVAKLPVETSKKVSVVLGDFFQQAFPEKLGLVFDYTFFCAIKPELRQKWARNMANIIQPGGLLVTIIFPIGDFENGPPFAVSFDAYNSLLSSQFELVHGPVESVKTIESRKERELIACWRRKIQTAL